jgi:hypothetical protein
MAEMNEKDFNELKESVVEVGLMMRGEIEPSREFVREKKLSPIKQTESWAICLSNEDDELVPMKIYKVSFQKHLKICTVKDELNETLVCPIDWFMPIELPTKINQALNIFATV